MILVDSSVWIDYLNARETYRTKRLDELLGSESLAIGDLILTEVLQGISDDREFELTRKSLTELPVITLGGDDVAVKAALYYRRLRKLGITVRKTIDVIIAARCIENDLTLLHDDRDFEPFVTYFGLRTAP